MKQYQFSFSFDTKNKSVVIVDDQEEVVGHIRKAVLRNCEKRHTYSYTSAGGAVTTLGLKKRKFKDLNISKYITVTDEKELVFKERPGSNLIHFRVDGEFEDQYLSFEESWNGDMEGYYRGAHIATIKEDVASSSTLILADSNLDEESSKFSILVLMYFMYKVYKRESWYIADMLS